MEALRSASHLRSAPAGVLFGEPERDRVQADVLQASLARKASCRQLDFHRIDYPQMDPPEWNKFVTIKLRGDKAKVDELPHGCFGDLKMNYEARNRDFTGVRQG